MQLFLTQKRGDQLFPVTQIKAKKKARYVPFGSVHKKRPESFPALGVAVPRPLWFWVRPSPQNHNTIVLECYLDEITM
jgi:hypothetical protein